MLQILQHFRIDEILEISDDTSHDQLVNDNAANPSLIEQLILI